MPSEPNGPEGDAKRWEDAPCARKERHARECQERQRRKNRSNRSKHEKHMPVSLSMRIPCVQAQNVPKATPSVGSMTPARERDDTNIYVNKGCGKTAVDRARNMRETCRQLLTCSIPSNQSQTILKATPSVEWKTPARAKRTKHIYFKKDSGSAAKDRARNMPRDMPTAIASTYLLTTPKR